MEHVQHGLCAVIPPTDDQASGLGFHVHRQPGAREGFKLFGKAHITPDSGCNGTCRGCGDEFLDGWMKVFHDAILGRRLGFKDYIGHLEPPQPSHG